jgi:hypothetical protein
MALTAGAVDCSSGFSSRLYNQLIGDTTRNGFQGNTPPAAWQDMVKSICYAAAKGVTDELNAQGYAPPIVPKEAFSTPLASDFSTSVITFSSSGVNFPIAANDVVAYDFEIPSTTNAGTTGMKLQLTGPASPLAVHSHLFAIDNTDKPVFFQATAFSTVLNIVTSMGSAERLHRLTGLIRNGTNAGTVDLQAASNINANQITIKAGAFVRYAKVN